jgi:hypothetical protein
MILENNNQQNNKRFNVHWGCDERNQCTRYIVIVYDKFFQKVIYTANTSKLKKEFEYIKRFYGEENCCPPKQDGKPVDLRKYF